MWLTLSKCRSIKYNWQAPFLISVKFTSLWGTNLANYKKCVTAQNPNFLTRKISGECIMDRKSRLLAGTPFGFLLGCLYL